MVPWICCQLGAREHYAIPRALSRLGTLDWLITDAWVPPSSILAKIVGERRSQIGDRWHEELKRASVTSFNWSLIAFEMSSRATRRTRGMAKNNCAQPLVPTQSRQCSDFLGRRSRGEGC